MTESIDVNREDIFKILIATDIHLGYNEKDIIRGQDSFIAFQEILHHARALEVDFVLLGGDLFHDSNPSKETLNRCLQLLHEYTLGDKPIEFQILSSHDVNYHNPNMNIAIPVFSIHGNHDDPSGYGGLSSVDILSTSGMLNYFGRCDDVEQVEIDPILLKKGTSQLAIYGLSHIHDNRLARIFRDSKVLINVPDERSGEWFNLMVLHQNRVDRGPKNFVPEEILPEAMDLILWGHEHDCRIAPESVANRRYQITQPGSSVATSLCEGESLEKFIGLLSIVGNKYKLDPIKLKTVRPFVFKSINLDDYEEEIGYDEADAVPKTKQLLSGIIEEMIAEAKGQETRDSPAQPKLPLIRLRVHFKDERNCFNTIRYGQQFHERVANPMDMVKMERANKRVKIEKRPVDERAMRNAFEKKDEEEEDIRLEDYVARYFNDPNNTDQLQVMHSKSLSEMCRRIAESQDKDAARIVIDVTKKMACAVLNDKMPEEEDIDSLLEEFRASGKEVYENAVKTIMKRRETVSGTTFKDFDISANSTVTSTSSRGGSTSRGGRGSRSTAAAKPTAAAKANGNTSTTRGGRSTRGTQQTLAQSMAKGSSRASSKKAVNYIADSDSD